MYFNVDTLEKHILYIICEMKFKDKTYGLNLLVTHYLKNWVATKEKLSHILLVYF
jgi:hypothetical protein